VTGVQTCALPICACGKSNVHDLEPEDLRALTLEASFITGIPVVGTNMVFGRPDLLPQPHRETVHAANGHGQKASLNHNNGKHPNGKHEKKRKQNRSGVKSA